MKQKQLSHSTHDNFRDWLAHEFTSRCKKNPRYSIRAFSQLLQMDSSSVSQLLSGKRQASEKMVKRLLEILAPSPEQRRALLSPTETTQTNHDYKKLTLDAYALIADWYHYAILEITYTQSFKNSPQWIAKKLNITALEAKLAIERLKRLGLLEEVEGKLVKAKTFITNFSHGDTSSALKKLQRKILEMALMAIDNTPMEEKDITSMTLAIVPEKLPEAREKIKKFRRELSEFLENGQQKRVYHLGIQLYPVSKE